MTEAACSKSDTPNVANSHAPLVSSRSSLELRIDADASGDKIVELRDHIRGDDECLVTGIDDA